MIFQDFLGFKIPLSASFIPLFLVAWVRTNVTRIQLFPCSALLVPVKVMRRRKIKWMLALLVTPGQEKKQAIFHSQKQVIFQARVVMHALCFCGGHLLSSRFLSIFLCPESPPLYHCSDLLPAWHQWGRRRWPSGDMTTAPWVSGPQRTGREACSVLTSGVFAEWPEELLQWPHKTLGAYNWSPLPTSLSSQTSDSEIQGAVQFWKFKKQVATRT